MIAVLQGIPKPTETIAVVQSTIVEDLRCFDDPVPVERRQFLIQRLSS